MRYCVIAVFFSLLLLSTSCDKSDVDSRHELREDLVLTKSQEKYVQAGNQFGFRLLNSSLQQEEEACLLSPLSAQIALGMLSAGASGDTEKQLVSALGFSEDAEGTMAYLSSLCGQLKNMDRKTDFDLANLLLLNSLRAGRVLPSYTEAVSSYADAKVDIRDFVSESEAIAKDVNVWSDKHTKGRIPKLVEPGTFTFSQVSHIINALYFKSQWSKPFKEEDTKPANFTSLNGNKASVPMMHQTEKFDYYEDSDLQALTMEYGNGAFSYTAILPKTGTSIGAVAGELENGLFQKISEQSSEQKVVVSLPKYEQEFTVDMIPLCQSLGLTLPFGEKADFSRMIQSNDVVRVTAFEQKLFISVDEFCAEASAVSRIEIDGGTAPPPGASHDIFFNANHPFIYLVSETSSQTVLFVGLFDKSSSGELSWH